jgi:hypothetical protein
VEKRKVRNEQTFLVSSELRLETIEAQSQSIFINALVFTLFTLGIAIILACLALCFEASRHFSTPLSLFTDLQSQYHNHLENM